MPSANHYDQLIVDREHGQTSVERTRRPKLPDQQSINAGERIRSRRTALKWTTADVAKVLGMSHPGYCAFEKSFGRLRQQKYLKILAPLLGVHPDWISQGDEHPTIEPPQLSLGSTIRGTRAGGFRMSVDQRLALGKRARERRLSLKLRPSDVAHVIGIETAKLKAMERALTAGQQLEMETKWEKVLAVPTGWLRDARIRSTAPDQRAIPISFNMPPCACVADEIRSVGCWLSRNSILRRTAQYNQLSAREQRFANIFAQRYGVVGEGETTLQAIGTRYGVSRERIRQVVDKMVERAVYFEEPTPLLDSLAQQLPPLLPQTVAQLDLSLRSELGESLSLHSLERFAREILGRSIVAMTENPAGMTQAWGVVAVDARTHDAAATRAVREVALGMIRSTGAAQIHFVAGAASAAIQRGLTPEEAARLCSFADGFEWLAMEDGWFWLGPLRENRLLTVARKVLAVAKRRVDVDDIHSAMARSRRDAFEPGKHRPYAIDAPHAVVVAALKRVPWIKTIQHDDFQLREQIEPTSLLSETEVALYNLLMAKGGVAARFTINQELFDSEHYRLSFISLQTALDCSPILCRVGWGMFALRGVALAPEALTIASSAVGGGMPQRRVAQAPDDEGYIPVTFALTAHAFQARYWEVPAYLAEQISEGAYEFAGESEPVMYTILPSGARRFRRFVGKLVNAGFQAGDEVLLRVHPQRRHITYKRIDTQSVQHGTHSEEPGTIAPARSR